MLLRMELTFFLLDWSGLVLWPLESTYYQWELGFSVLEQYL